MTAKEPWAQLDELIAKTTERLSATKRENATLASRIRELEAERERIRKQLEEASGEGKRVTDLETRVKTLEHEREEARRRVEGAAAKLRKLLAGTPETAGADPADDAESAEVADEA